MNFLHNRRRLVLAATVLASLALSGCTATDPLIEQANSGTTNYVAGDGSVAEFDLASRSEPVELSGKLFDGTRVSESDWKGQVAVLNVWYAACAPCRIEAPDLAALHGQFAPQGVQFFGINTRDEAPTAAAFERTFGTDYPSIRDKDGKVLLALTDFVPANAVPTTLVLDKEGRVSARILGAADKSVLTALIRDVLEEDR